MNPDATCYYFAKLPETRRLRGGERSRCPACKGPIVVDHNAGTTYRLVENEEGGKPKSFFARLWKVAVPLVIVALVPLF